MPLWAAEDMDEELQDVDVNIGLGSYGQGEMYDEGALTSCYAYDS